MTSSSLKGTISNAGYRVTSRGCDQANISPHFIKKLKIGRKKRYHASIPRVIPVRKYSCDLVVYGEKYRQS
jgi:hypothetical protein